MVKKISSLELIELITKKATEQGFLVARVNTPSRQGYSTKDLLINNKRCRLYSSRHCRARPNHEIKHSALTFSTSLLKKLDIAIVYQYPPGALPRLLIIPTRVLTKDKYRDHFMIWVPIEGRIYYNPNSIDLNRYTDGWQYFGKIAPSSAQ